MTQDTTAFASPASFDGRFRRILSARFGGGVSWVGWATLLLLVTLAAFPESVAPYDPRARSGLPLERPSPSHWLGTNDIGQDLLSELIAGTRVSLVTGLSVALVAIAIGTLIGLVSGFASGAFDGFLMRLVDLTLVLPFLPLVILLSAYLGPSQRNVVLVLALVFWAPPARLIRSRVLSLLREPYVDASRSFGAGAFWILLRHIWPGVRALAIVQGVLIASASILAEASLSFLGLGDPATKSWGTMLFFARASGAFLSDAWLWWVLPTGLMITLTVLSLVLIGYGLEQANEPGLGERSFGPR